MGGCLLPYTAPCRCIFPSLPSRPGEPGESGPPVRRRSAASTSPGRSAPRPGTTPRGTGATRRPPGSADGARSPGAPGGPGQGGPPGGEGSRRQLSEKKAKDLFLKKIKPHSRIIKRLMSVFHVRSEARINFQSCFINIGVPKSGLFLIRKDEDKGGKKRKKGVDEGLDRLSSSLFQSEGFLIYNLSS